MSLCSITTAKNGGWCCTLLAGLVRSMHIFSTFILALVSCTKYTLYYLVIFVLFPQPPYQGTTKAVELSSSSLSKVLENKQANAKIVELDEDEQPLVDVPMAKYWVILIYANWSVASRNFEAVLAGLSLRYDGPNVKFGEFTDDLEDNTR